MRRLSGHKNHTLGLTWFLISQPSINFYFLRFSRIFEPALHEGTITAFTLQELKLQGIKIRDGVVLSRYSRAKCFAMNFFGMELSDRASDL